jgi:hypothetical protein
MTMSEFDTLRADLRSLQTDLESRFGALRMDMETRFAKLEAKLDEKPSVNTIYQAALTMFAVMVGTVMIMKSIGVIP